MPAEVDFAVVGGGFTGLSAAAWLRRLAPNKRVALFESGSIGAGASGHTGGMTLAETTAGDLPGLGDVLAGFEEILQTLAVDCDFALPGAWEIGRSHALRDSPIEWEDSGRLSVVAEVPGGTIDPGKLVSGLARAAETNAASIFEYRAVEDIALGETVRLELADRHVVAKEVLFATNAMSLELNGLAGRAQPHLTLALATEPLTDYMLGNLGVSSGRPFYTVDFPYLWGRVLRTGAVVFGSGLVKVDDWRELADLDVSSGQAAHLMSRLKTRVRGLHPALRDVHFTHEWGGPILIPDGWRPVFARHPRNPHAIVLGGYSGHGVALSVYLGRWAAEVLCGQRALPDWNAAEKHR
jgi:gamma-glutamylputrescine oxidase